jgi:hypothetical protein
VSDLNNITIVDTINSHALATPHNPYIVGNNWCWISTYQDGIYLYDISTPSNTTIYGYFDTHPQHGVNDNFSTSAYRGNWGAYPYLPSKIIIACDMQNGIFILQGDSYYNNSVVGVKQIKKQSSIFSIYPNPTTNELNFLIANQFHKNLKCSIADVLGKVVYVTSLIADDDFYKTSINTSLFKDGCYFVTLTGITINETKKIIIQH